MQTINMKSFQGVRLAPQQRLSVRRAVAHRCVVRAAMAGGASGEDPYQVSSLRFSVNFSAISPCCFRRL
jgi:hypothetical protein